MTNRKAIFKKVRFLIKNSTLTFFQKAKKMIQKKVDIRTIIDALNELEKLKLLLFDQDQYFLFEHIPKPFLMNAEAMKKKPKKKSKQVVDEEKGLEQGANDEGTNQEDLLRVNDFWSKGEVSDSQKLDNFCEALENVMEKSDQGTMNVIDKRLLDILHISHPDD
jgi:hypothetical protein